MFALTSYIKYRWSYVYNVIFLNGMAHVNIGVVGDKHVHYNQLAPPLQLKSQYSFIVAIGVCEPNDFHILSCGQVNSSN